jgi:hypothetical protein
MKSTIGFTCFFIIPTSAFITPVLHLSSAFQQTTSSALFMTDEVKAATTVTGEELELMLTEWDLPLVVDAYATWYDYLYG